MAIPNPVAPGADASGPADVTRRRPVLMGEKVEDLLPALLALHDSAIKDDDGTWSFGCTLPEATVAPLCRALMRVEARLLREDANRLSPDMRPWRTPDQRRADAFVELVKMLPRR